MAPKKVSYPRWLNECPNLWWYNPYEIPSSRFLSPWLISRRHTMAACWNYHGSQPTWLGQDFSETNPHRSSNNRKPQDSSNVHVQRPLNLGNVGTTATTTTIHNKPPLFSLEWESHTSIQKNMVKLRGDWCRWHCWTQPDYGSVVIFQYISREMLSHLRMIFRFLWLLQ